jgi:hypothetical protein
MEHKGNRVARISTFNIFRKFGQKNDMDETREQILRTEHVSVLITVRLKVLQSLTHISCSKLRRRLYSNYNTKSGVRDTLCY